MQQQAALQCTVFGQWGLQAALAGRRLSPAACWCQPVPTGMGSPWPSALTRLRKSGSREGPETPCWGHGCSWKKVTHTRGRYPLRDRSHGCPTPGWGHPPCRGTAAVGAPLGWRHKDAEWQRKTSKKERGAGETITMPPQPPASSIASTGRWDRLTV